MDRTIEIERPPCPVLGQDGPSARPCFFRVQGCCCHSALENRDECPQERLGLTTPAVPAQLAGRADCEKSGTTWELSKHCAGRRLRDMRGEAMTTQHGARRPGVLVVDNEPLVRDMLDKGLRREGFWVWAAGDAQEALELYQRHRHEIDLVLLEVQLPGLDGPQTRAALRQLNPEISCCFMTTGNIGNYTEEELVGLDVTVLLDKPFRPDEVAQVLRRLLGQSLRGPHKRNRFPSVLSER